MGLMVADLPSSWNKGEEKGKGKGGEKGEKGQKGEKGEKGGYVMHF